MNREGAMLQLQLHGYAATALDAWRLAALVVVAAVACSAQLPSHGHRYPSLNHSSESSQTVLWLSLSLSRWPALPSVSQSPVQCALRYSASATSTLDGLSPQALTGVSADSSESDPLTPHR